MTEPLYGDVKTVMELTGASYREARGIIADAGFPNRKKNILIAPCLAVVQQRNQKGLQAVAACKSRGSKK